VILKPLIKDKNLLKASPFAGLFLSLAHYSLNEEAKAKLLRHAQIKHQE
jgi:hypothetical protein